MVQLAQDINISVKTHYLAEQSQPDNNHYAFAYTITIENAGDTPIRLIARNWIITDGNGKVEEVHGIGVVGEQPYLTPGKPFKYTSHATLETPVGTMHGSYQMQTDTGEVFEVAIEPFRLAVPHTLH